MTPTQTGKLAAGGLVLLLATAILAARLSPDANAGVRDATAAVAFITGAALGIERFIEMLWTIIGGVKGTFWPLNVVRAQVDSFVTGLDDVMRPFHQDLTADLDKLKDNVSVVATRVKQTETEVIARIDEGTAEIAKLAEDFEKLSESLKDSPKIQRAQLLAAAAARNASYLRTKYSDLLPRLNRAEHVANSAINGLQDFLATFKDNPARRLISLFAGAILGLVVAGIFGLDVFAALLEEGTELPAWVRDTKLSLIATGLIIGFGSNPTHEVIRAIQEHKEQNKGENSGRPNLPTRSPKK